jgi:ATP-dependent Clp protease ATP-binding subunit ClpA
MTFSDEVEGVLHRVYVAACEAGHAKITPEHIALELIVEDETGTYLERCGTDLVAVESRLRSIWEEFDRTPGRTRIRNRVLHFSASSKLQCNGPKPKAGNI